MRDKKYEVLQYRPLVWQLPFVSLVLLWLVYFIDWKYALGWREYGLWPQQWIGLRGVLTMPFLHGNVAHLSKNSLALMVLMPLLLYYYPKLWRKVLIFGVLGSGLLTWFIAQTGNHIGASALIYVLIGFLFFSGIRSKHYRLMAVSFVTVIIYGSSVWYMLPEVEKGISWEGHLAGFIVGTSMAYVMDLPLYEPKYSYAWQAPDYDARNDDFMQQFDDDGQFAPKPKCIVADDGYVYRPSFAQHIALKNKRIGKIIFF